MSFLFYHLNYLRKKKTTVQSNVECCLRQKLSASFMLWKGSLKKRGIFYFLSTGISSSYVEYETNKQNQILI